MKDHHLGLPDKVNMGEGKLKHKASDSSDGKGILGQLHFPSGKLIVSLSGAYRFICAIETFGSLLRTRLAVGSGQHSEHCHKKGVCEARELA